MMLRGNGGGKACDQSRKISLSRLTCQNRYIQLLNLTKAKIPGREVAKMHCPFMVLDNSLSQRRKLHFVMCREAPLERAFSHASEF